MLPIHIQRHVDREYAHAQSEEWEVKTKEADVKLQILIAKQFPEFYKKKYLEPYEEGSELWIENEALLRQAREELDSTESKTTDTDAEMNEEAGERWWMLRRWRQRLMQKE